MSFDGHAASSSGCAIRPKEHETGSTASGGRTRISLHTGCYVMGAAEHREPCESRGSRTVLGAPGGETPPGDSTISAQVERLVRLISAQEGPRPQRPRCPPDLRRPARPVHLQIAARAFARARGGRSAVAPAGRTPNAPPHPPKARGSAVRQALIMAASSSCRHACCASGEAPI